MNKKSKLRIFISLGKTPGFAGGCLLNYCGKDVECRIASVMPFEYIRANFGNAWTERSEPETLK